MNKQKYYTLEELKVGMEVSTLSLSKIYDVVILLDRSTFRFDEEEMGFGKILAIDPKVWENNKDTIPIFNRKIDGVDEEDDDIE